MRIVGLTGGIACGKSTVVDLLRENGIGGVVDMDVVTREVQARGSATFRRLVATFGEGIVGEDGELDRKRLGDVIFADAEKRRALNRIMQPALAMGMLRKLAYHFCVGTPVVILDAPLLFEVKPLRSICAETLVVYVDGDTQLERLMRRDQRGRDDAVQRIASQMPLEEKRALADVVIDNSGSRADLDASVKSVLPRLTRFTWHRILSVRPAPRRRWGRRESAGADLTPEPSPSCAPAPPRRPDAQLPSLAALAAALAAAAAAAR